MTRFRPFRGADRVFLGPIPTASIPAAATQLAGALVFDTTLDKLKFCTGTVWLTIGDSLTVETATLQLAAEGHLYLGPFATGDIPAATAGLEACLIYDTTLNKLKFCTGAAWETVTST